MKKGFTLVELIMALGLISSILTIEFRVLAKEINYYKLNVKETREENYIDEAILFIKQQLQDEVLNINISDNEIKIRKNNGDINKIYCKDVPGGKKVMISYYNKYGYPNIPKATNKIIYNIKDFKIEKNKNLIFITICSRRNKNYIRCFHLK